VHDVRNQSDHRRLDDIDALPQLQGAQDYFFVDESMYSISCDCPTIWKVWNHTVRGRMHERGRILQEESDYIVELDGDRMREHDLHDALSHFAPS
jgi:hypothetical protein